MNSVTTNNSQEQFKTNTSSSEKDQNIQLTASSFTLEEIRSELTCLKEVLELRQVLWETECAVYDGTSTGEETETRNRSNFQRVIQYDTLFPYSNQLYPLVTAYDGGIVRDGVLHNGAMFHYDEDSSLEVSDDILPCRDEDIIQLLIPEPFVHRRGVDVSLWCSRPAFEDDDDNEDNEEVQSYISHWTFNYNEEPSLSTMISTHPPKNYHGPLLRSDKEILLKLIRHATSDIQRDFRLAAAACLCIAALQCCSEDLDFLRHFIGVVSANDFPALCDGGCSQSVTDHNCHDVFTLYLTSIEILITHGIHYLTEGHAKVLCAWALFELDQVSDSDIDALYCAADEVPFGGSRLLLAEGLETVFKRQKALLKQTLQSNKDTLPPKFKPMLVKSVIIAIGKHAVLDKTRMNIEDKNRAHYLDSWINCIRALVNIAENCLRRLPLQNITDNLVSHLVRSFCEAFAPSQLHKPDEVIQTPLSTSSIEQETTTDNVSASLFSSTALPVIPWDLTLSNPNRYANTVLNASDYYNGLISGTRESIIMTPSPTVQTIVRALFYRFDVDTSKYGYGDWLAICKLAVTPYDSLLFNSRANVCSDASYEDEDDEEVSGERLVARHEFSLVMLVRAWRKPWNPKSHRSFQPSFRSAAKTVAMCTHRRGLPNEITVHLVSFFNRDWWPDERKKCWCNVCQYKDIISSLTTSISFPVIGSTPSSALPPSSSSTLRTCKGCNLALYCCKEHKRYILQDGHKIVCGAPPFRVPGKEEERLCEEVAKNCNIGVVLETNTIEPYEGVPVAENDNADDDDDESLWESINSNDSEDNKGSVRTTSIIYNFFKKFYDLRRVEEPAFARHFADD